MPFVTETIWQELPAELKDHDILMVAKWPLVK
jgi:valyl-tRNA synthetase